ncbi:MAG: hypothetical protein QF554_05390 [Dehalococcoidia bacterium]|jgi:hypothetical protein|nr:hypothetical protein [Dehalococcoidia bacterium]
MTIIAGFLAGALMALIFVAHLSLMFVYNPPNFIRNADAEDNNLPRVILMLHGMALLIWPVIGIAAALAYAAVSDEVADGVFVAGVLVVELLMAPVLVVLMKGRRLHLVAQFGAFFIIFGVVVPVLVSRA